MKEKLASHIQAHPYPLLFATLSGAHLYGFASPDSDFDLRPPAAASGSARSATGTGDDER